MLITLVQFTSIIARIKCICLDVVHTAENPEMSIVTRKLLSTIYRSTVMIVGMREGGEVIGFVWC